MNAECVTTMTLRGTNEELIDVILAWMNSEHFEQMVSFSTKIARGSAAVRVRDLEKVELHRLIEENDGDVQISDGFGVYTPGIVGGIYGDGSSNPFCVMADAAPHAEFEVVMDGKTTYSTEKLEGGLHNGMLNLHITYWDEEAEHAGMREAFLAYVKERLSYERFIALFKLDEDEFDEYAYEDFIDEFLTDEGSTLADIEYDEFVEFLDMDEVLSEDEYEAAMEDVGEIEIQSYEEFSMEADDMSVSTEMEVRYNPITKEYIKSEDDSEADDECENDEE